MKTLTFLSPHYYTVVQDGIGDWELDALMRSWLLEYRERTVSTLFSVAQLIAKMPLMAVSSVDSCITLILAP